MTSRDFAYWLQGFFEIANPDAMTKEQTAMVKKHLGLVFFHEIDPSYSKDKRIQEDMNKIHKPSDFDKTPPFGGDPLVRC